MKKTEIKNFELINGNLYSEEINDTDFEFIIIKNSSFFYCYPFQKNDSNQIFLIDRDRESYLYYSTLSREIYIK